MASGSEATSSSPRLALATCAEMPGLDEEGRLLMGREGWFDEVMRFFDHHVREVPLADAPADAKEKMLNPLKASKKAAKKS